MKVKAEFPEKLQPLFTPKRYKIMYGGRGGAKSWGIARALLIRGAQKSLRILCARELQKSIKTSVHQVLSDQIKLLNLQAHYKVFDASIRGINGTEFAFEGLRHNANQIKSYEGADICWVEEAATVSKSSWKFLIPTIRKEGSEIWVSFNPELEEDETYQRFIMNPPTESILIEINWRDNPWFSSVLKQEMKDDFKRDEAEALVVWEGRCRQAVEGAIFEDEMIMLKKEGRVMRVPYDRKKPVNTFWDLGRSDQTAIWFIQKVGLEYRVIDFYCNARKLIQHYIEVLQNKGYCYGTDYLPHDGSSDHLVGDSVESTLEGIGRTVEVVARIEYKPNSINAARVMFPSCVFDKENCADGLMALKRYRYAVDPDTKRTTAYPVHDIYSNPADAFQTFANVPHITWEAYTGQGGGEYKADYDPYDEDRL